MNNDKITEILKSWSAIFLFAIIPLFAFAVIILPDDIPKLCGLQDYFVVAIFMIGMAVILCAVAQMDSCLKRNIPTPANIFLAILMAAALCGLPYWIKGAILKSGLLYNLITRSWWIIGYSILTPVIAFTFRGILDFFKKSEKAERTLTPGDY